ncbi:hypothetical protein OUZ56_008977 [Daphnia magna]|uniref:Uncharacterized protein n=1 Tax=Daphnia magna TaxID=35525 RepID=A0ABR0AEP2_9CRUS|nr:hypothetical protein OUZ56_008977 [Daphnia magna]
MRLLAVSKSEARLNISLVDLALASPRPETIHLDKLVYFASLNLNFTDESLSMLDESEIEELELDDESEELEPESGMMYA